MSRDHTFSAAAEDYISLWFRSSEPGLSCDNVYVEAGPYAARPADMASISEDGWLATCKVPPGLKPQWHDVRLRVANSQFSNAIRIPVDLSMEQRKQAEPMPLSRELKIEVVTDGKTWDRWKVKTGADSCLAIWASGIPDDCDADQIGIRLEPASLAAVFLSETDPNGLKQINAILPSGIPPGTTSLTLICKGVASEPVEIELTP